MGRVSWLQRPLADNATLLMVFAVTLMSTMGFENDDVAYRGVVVVCAILQLAHLDDVRWTLRDMSLSLILLSVGAVSLVVTGTATLLLTSVLLVCAHEVQVDLLLKSVLSAKVVGLVLLFAFGFFGVFDVTAVEHYKFSVGEVFTRIRINGASTNVMHLSFATMVALWLYFNFGQTRVVHYVVVAAANLALFFTMTYSYMGLLVTMMVLVVGLLLEYREGFRVAMVKYFWALLPACLVFSVATGFLYTHVGLMNTLDSLMQGRIYYNHLFLTEYPITLFGADFSTYRGNLDNSYITVLYKFGLVPFVAIFGFMAYVSAKLARKGDFRKLFVVGFFMVAGLSESFYASAAVNASLYIALAFLYEGRDCDDDALDSNVQDCEVTHA